MKRRSPACSAVRIVTMLGESGSRGAAARAAARRSRRPALCGTLSATFLSIQCLREVDGAKASAPRVERICIPDDLSAEKTSARAVYQPAQCGLEFGMWNACTNSNSEFQVSSCDCALILWCIDSYAPALDPRRDRRAAAHGGRAPHARAADRRSATTVAVFDGRGHEWRGARR